MWDIKRETILGLLAEKGILYYLNHVGYKGQQPYSTINCDNPYYLNHVGYKDKQKKDAIPKEIRII